MSKERVLLSSCSTGNAEDETCLVVGRVGIQVTIYGFDDAFEGGKFPFEDLLYLNGV